MCGLALTLEVNLGVCFRGAGSVGGELVGGQIGTHFGSKVGGGALGGISWGVDWLGGRLALTLEVNWGGWFGGPDLLGVDLHSL